jgi:RNA polymerase sigma-70 factor, ECF subfamily
MLWLSRIMDPANHDADIVALLMQHQQSLRLYIESLMPGDPQADDVAQESNTKIWEKRGDFEIGTNFKAWIFSIARFQVRKWRFRQAKDERLVFCDELEDTISEEIPNHLDELSLHQKALQECLKTLKPAHRELLHQRYFEKTSLEQYSAQVGRSVGVLKVTLHRLRSKLLTCVEKKLSSEKELRA